MSNYIYNDDFSTLNGYGNNEEIEDNSTESKISTRLLITICIACAVFSLLFGVLGGFIVSSNRDIKTDVYTNTIYKAPVANQLASSENSVINLADVV